MSTEFLLKTKLNGVKSNWNHLAPARYCVGVTLLICLKISEK